MIIKERLDEALTQVRTQIAMDVKNASVHVDFIDGELLTKSSGFWTTHST
jgi:hypothetical protein